MADEPDLDLFGEPALPVRRANFGRRVFLTAPQRARAEEMRRQGAAVKDIADELGVAEATAWHRLGPELERGLPGGRGPGRPSYEPTPADRARVVELVAEGVPLGRIAAALGVSVPTLKLHCAGELGGRRRQRGRQEADAVRPEIEAKGASVRLALPAR